jgi:2-amino-4-hydroxy-6-hydroxymethyldihydropteridine diphosphokinase
MGDRLAYLQHGLDATTAIGHVCTISSVVETPAVGFEGNPFLNDCFTIDTELTPAVVMQKLLDIEQSQGRSRSQGQGYQNRTLDLDMIFYDDFVLDTPNLILPHPSISQRRFVLQPLCEIAPHKQHPVDQKPIQALLYACEDNTPLSIHEKKLRHPIYAKLSTHTFICLEGIIGCGKTTLTKLLAQNLGYKTIEERFAENPFLPKFYREPKRYAFPLELSFLADRFNQINKESEQLDLFQSGVVADYHMSKSLVFAQNTLNEDEYPLFHQLYELMSKSANQPSLCIYLRQTPERAKANIKKRGRNYEQNIGTDYLGKLAKGYDQHLPFLQQRMQVVSVDVTALDFVLNPEDLVQLLRSINAQLAEVV